MLELCIVELDSFHHLCIGLLIFRLCPQHLFPQNRDGTMDPSHRPTMMVYRMGQGVTEFYL